MIESEKSSGYTIEKNNFEQSSNYPKSSKGRLAIFNQLSELEKQKNNFQRQNQLNSVYKKLNEHEYDMLHANQANLKCSASTYAKNIKQVININSTINERYHKLHTISLHHILTKGKDIFH